MKDKSTNATVINGAAWKLGERLLTQGVSFVVSLVLARLLSPDDYGVIALVMIFITLADVFITSGFATALIQKKNADSLDFSTIFYCSFVCSLVIYGIVFFSAPLIARFYDNDLLTELTRVFALRIPLSCLYSIQSAYISRHMQFRFLFFSGLAGQLISGVCGIAMAYAGFGVWALVAQNFVNIIISTLVLLIILPWRPQWLFSFSRAKGLMRYGSGVLLADLSGTFFGNLRGLIIGKVYTEADLAYYNKGQQLPQLISTNLSTTVMSVLFPAMANATGDAERLKQMVRRSMQSLSCMVCPVLFGMAAVMGPLIMLLYTDKWAACVFFGQLYCIDYAFGVLGLIPLQALKAMGKSSRVLKLEVYKKPVYFILLVVGVCLNVKAIAITMLVYEIYGTIVNFLQLKKYLSYSVREIISDIYLPFALSALMLLIVPFISITGHLILTLTLQILCGAALYIAGSALLRGKGFYYLLGVLKVKMKGKH